MASLPPVSSQKEYFRCRDHSDNILKRMQNCLENKQLCDVVLVAGIDKKRISAHRLVLSASSDYFAAMFTGSLTETKQEVVTLGEVHGDALQSLIQFCYTGRIELREDTVERLLVTACLLQLNAVKTACCNFLARQLHPSNCLGIALFAEQQNCGILFNQAYGLACLNFMQVCKNEEFFQLNAEQLAQLLSNDEIKVPSEVDVFYALISWIEHDPRNREKFVPELLARVRLPLLRPSFIEYYVESVCGASGWQQLIKDALKLHLIPNRQTQISLEPNHRRKSRYETLPASVSDEFQIEVYWPRLDKWATLENMAEIQSQLTDAALGDCPFYPIMFDGRDGLKSLNTVKCSDTNKMGWIELQRMRTPRYRHCLAILEGALYAIGGRKVEDNSILNTVERWDPITRAWNYVASMSKRRLFAGVAVLGDRLYVVGGQNESKSHKSVECYDPHTDKWILRAPMNKYRNRVGVGVANGYLYALGGSDCPEALISPNAFNSMDDSRSAVLRSCTDTVEQYDPGTDTWTFIASLNDAHQDIKVAVLGDKLIASHGYKGHGRVTFAEKYDPERNEWYVINPLNYSSLLITLPNATPLCFFQ